MKDYVTDPRTGFLTPAPTCVGPSFNADQKEMFVHRFTEHFNFTKAAASVGATRRMVLEHLKDDKAFREAFEDATEEILDEVEESLFRQSKKSPIAVMQLLKAKRPEKWGVKKDTKPVDKPSDKLKALLDDTDEG